MILFTIPGYANMNLAKNLFIVCVPRIKIKQEQHIKHTQKGIIIIIIYFENVPFSTLS